jgi:NAD(P)-dependent dehydrogenase (short-subunit alcohol dehydrogenase family)
VSVSAESVLVTGTTSGIGRALLELYAKRGARVVAVNRRRVAELESRYPDVRFECVDVQNARDVAALIGRLGDAAQLPEVFILNAGINRVDNDASFDVAAYQSVLQTNLLGVLNFVEPLTRLGRGPRARHIVAVSSMASYVGNPYGLGYTTSKQALNTCFEVWSRMYAGTDLVFQRVMLGPVATDMFAMHDSFPGWMVRLKRLFSASLDGSARAIAGFATTRRRRLFHPWSSIPLYSGMWLSRALIAGFFRGTTTRSGQTRRKIGSAP